MTVGKKVFKNAFCAFIAPRRSFVEQNSSVFNLFLGSFYVVITVPPLEMCASKFPRVIFLRDCSNGN